MKTSRVAAAAAAVAIGFGVTLAGVVVGDDNANDDTEAEADADGNDELDAAEQASTPVEDPDEAELIEPEPTNSADRPVDETQPTTPVLDDQPGSTVEPPAPDGPVSADADEGIDIDDVRCVATISVALDTGEQLDYVVEASEGATAWRVFDVDGQFVISRDDEAVVEVVEVLRNVRFFQGAPVNFFDVCDEVGPADDSASNSDAASDTSNDPGTGNALAVLNFPCSDRALNQLRQLLLDEETAVLDDVSEVQLALAIRLDQLGGSDLDTWLAELERELVGFRSFSDECPAAVESGFTRSGVFCAAARISADDSLFDFLVTVVPTAMSDCTYEPDPGGEF